MIVPNTMVSWRNNWEKKCLFDQRNFGKHNTTLTLYNYSGRLFLYLGGHPACTWYDRPWIMIRPCDFAGDQDYLVISDKMFAAGLLRDQVGFRLIDIKASGEITIGVGTIWFGSKKVIERTFYVPPSGILYLSVHLGHVKDSLLIFHPLPSWMFHNCEVVEKVGSQALVAVK